MIRTGLFFALVFFLPVLPAGASPDSAPRDALKAAVLHADDARLRAMEAGDLVALDRLLAPDCLYVHSNGTTQTRSEFLAALKSGALKYLSIRPATPPQVRLCGDDCAIVTGPTQVEVARADGTRLSLALVVTAVYALADGRWQLVSYQSTGTVPAK